MKCVLIFLVLIALVMCNPLKFSKEERQKRKEEFQKQIADCILKSESASADLKKKIKDNKDDVLKNVLHLYLSKLDSKDREALRKCRKELVEKMKGTLKDKLHDTFNATNVNNLLKDLKKNKKKI